MAPWRWRIRTRARNARRGGDLADRGRLPRWYLPGTQERRFIHFFARRAADLERRLSALLSRLRRDGMIWISWPKRASKIATDMTEDVVRRIALPLGLVDVKVCAIDEVWSGLKLVVRKELR